MYGYPSANKPSHSRDTNEGLRHILLALIILADGFADPYTQIPSVFNQACEGFFPLHRISEIQNCEILYIICYPTKNQRAVKKATLRCVPAYKYCFEKFIDSLIQSAMILFTVSSLPNARASCDPTLVQTIRVCEKHSVSADSHLPHNPVPIAT